MRRHLIAAAALPVLLLGACGDSATAPGDAPERAAAQRVETEEEGPIEGVGRLRGPEIKVQPPERPWPKKLVVRDLEVGSGPGAKLGDKVTIQFTALRFNGTVFETSWEFGHPFRFELGTEEVSPGWEEGLPGMKVGGRRELLVPWTMISQTGIVPGTGPGDGQVYVVEMLDLSGPGRPEDFRLYKTAFTQGGQQE